jgi:hypothetical protein
MGQPYPDEYDYFDDDTPRPSKRGPVAIFLLGWLVLPIAATLLGELESPWFEIGCAATLAFIAVFLVALVRVVKNF